MKKIAFLSTVVATVFAGCSFLSEERAQTVRVKPGADGPLSASTLEAARDLVRAARKDGRLSPEKPIEVVVAPGIYSLSEVFQLGKEDSGTPERPIVWRAEKPGTVRFLGGVKLESSSFAPVSDKAVLDRLLPEARAKALVADVSAHLPGALAPWPNQLNVPPAPWLYVDGVPGECARWPNLDEKDGGWAYFVKSVDTGYPVKDRHSNARNDMHPGAFRWEFPDRGARWNFAKGVWLYGYWTHDWSENSIKAKGFENTPTNQVMRLAGTHSYGCGNGTWGAKKRRFFVYNLLEELDRPGEWYLDRETKRLYVIPGEGWDKADIVLATSTKPFMRVADAHDIVVEGFSFECSHTTSPALTLHQTERVVVRDCGFSNLAGSALSLGGKRCRVEGCRMWNLGKNAISLAGGDRKKLVKAENVVENCDIHHYARFQRTYAPAVYAGGCGQIVRGCRMHHAPHNAILYGGNEHLFESNEVYRVLVETGDAGAFYTGRDSSTLGNVIRGNYFHDLGKDPMLSDYTMAIYFDDCDWGDAVYDNLFERAGSAVFIGGGNLHPVYGNVFLECPVGVHIDARGVTWRKSRNAFGFDKDGVSWFERKLRPFDFRSDTWRRAYPELEGLLKDRPDYPRMNPVTNNVFVACKRNFSIGKPASEVTNECPVVGNVFYTNRADAVKAGVRLEWNGAKR